MTDMMTESNGTPIWRRRPVIWGGAILVIVVAVMAFRSFNAPKGGAGGAAAGAPAGGMPPMPVDVDTAKRGRVVDAVQATGRIEALQSIDVRPDEQGRVTAILVREGQYVDRGTPLVKIDDEMLQAQATKAEAERDLAKQKLARIERLRTENAAPQA